MIDKTWSTGPAAAISGIPRRTLARWAEEGFLVPSVQDSDHRGSSRVYSFRDLVAARAALALRRQGVPMQRLRKAVNTLKALGVDEHQPLASVVLIARGDDVFLVTADQVMSVLSKPGQLAITTIDLAAEVAYIKQGIKRLEAAM